MPRLPCLISLGFILALTTNAYAEGGLYAGVLFGANHRPDTFLTSPGLGSEKMEFEPGYTLGGFMGYDFGNHFRMEGELSYRENNIRTGGGTSPQAGTSAMMFNIFYDSIPYKESYGIYLGGGLGVVTAQLQTISLGQDMNENQNVFAYQLEAGVGWNITPNATFTLGYRFLDPSDPEFELSTGPRIRIELIHHEAILKLRYRFNL